MDAAAKTRQREVRWLIGGTNGDSVIE
jgi:hypothetical protein